MSGELIVNSVIWLAFLVWAINLLLKGVRQRRVERAISLGYAFSLKYRLLRKLHGNNHGEQSNES